MKNIHFFHNSWNLNPFVTFLNNNFNNRDHNFFIYGPNIKDELDVLKNENVKKISYKINKILILQIDLYRSEKIFLHGLYNNWIVVFLFLQPWLLKKTYWIIWGGDLYVFKKNNRTLKKKIHEVGRMFVIKRFAGLITHIKGDYELAKKWYGAKGKHHYSFMYPSNLYKDIEISHEINNRKLYIQVGNSADSSNNHIEILNKLKALGRNDFQIIVPLSYGEKEYAKKVIKVGTKMFGENFTPLEDFIPLNEYLNLLSEIDIAIFNHDRQQALGNITTLIGLGKTIYMKSDITSTQFLRSMGIQLFDVENIVEDLPVLSENAIQKNRNIIKSRFSEEELVKDLKKIFQGS